MASGEVKRIALERMHILFEEAGNTGDKKLQDRYVYLALKLSTYNKAGTPTELKLKYCKKCGSFLQEGKTSIVRLDKKGWKVTCGFCQRTRKIGYPSRIKSKKEKDGKILKA